MPTANASSNAAAPSSAEKPGRRVQPLESLNPYTSSWSVRVRVSGKQAPRTIKTQRGETKVFSVDLTDEQVCHTCVGCPGQGAPPRGVCALPLAWKEGLTALSLSRPPSFHPPGRHVPRHRVA